MELMARISVINRVDVSARVVKKLLKSNSVLSLSIKHIEIHPRDIVLVTVGDSDGNVVIFDVKSCPGIVHEGELWRIIVADAVTKVIHDCRPSVSALMRQYKLRLRNVFDTQAAFCLLMIEQRLPPRLISIKDLYQKCGDPGQRMSAAIEQANAIGGGICWAQRPMPAHLINALATEVRVLLPVLHENLLRELPDVAGSFMDELCVMFINGDFFQNDRGNRPVKSAKKSKRRPILRLTDRQRTLLHATIPQGAEGLDSLK